MPTPRPVIIRVRNLFSFRGRIGRAGMWAVWPLAFACVGVVGLLIYVLLTALGVMTVRGDLLATAYDEYVSSVVAVVVAVPFALAFDWLFFAFAVRRLHDRNKSGWWLAVYLLVTIGFVNLDALVPSGTFVQSGKEVMYVGPSLMLTTITSGLGWLGACATQAWMWVELLLLPGTPGSNRFGPFPLPK